MTLDRISPGPGASPRTTAAAVSSQLVSMPRTVHDLLLALSVMGRCFTPFGQEMPMKILVTRPLADGQEIATRLAELGHQALLAPLLEPRFFDGPEPALDDVQAILATSANGIRALIRRTPRRDIPIFAVGPQTAEEATKAGFAEVRSADGDAVALAEAAARWARPEGVLLHVCGEDAPGRLADTLADRGFPVRRV